MTLVLTSHQPSPRPVQVCFAAAVPVAWRGEERLYYMGGNGPHSGARNSSFGLATLRRDGYAAVRASATTSDPSPPSTLWLNMPES